MFGGGDGAPSAAQQQQQAAVLQAQTMILKQTQLQLKVLGTCFTQCVPSMNSELNSSEQKCIYKCVTSLIETEDFLQSRLKGMQEKISAQ